MGDDQPYVLSTPKGELIEMRREWANDDWPHYATFPPSNMLSRGDVWIAPLSQIAGHVRRLIDSGEWKPRIVEVERTDPAATGDG